jgi:signal transduction histidine kinase
LLQTDPAMTKSILVELQTVIRSTVSDIRRLVHDLRPPALDELGLVGAIQERINDLSRPLKPSSEETGNEFASTSTSSSSSSVSSQLQFRLDAPEFLPTLPAAVEVAAFRIVTEAIVNVVRHAGASICEVSIRLNKGLEVEIRDNGHGLREKREANPSGGIGMHSMRERAEELGGYCLMEANPNGGTKIMAWLPISEEEQGSESA